MPFIKTNLHLSKADRLLHKLISTAKEAFMQQFYFTCNIQGGLVHATVVPATTGSLGERPPALAGHFCDVPTTLPC